MKTKAIQIVEQMENEKYSISHDKFKVGDTIKVEYLRTNQKDNSKKDKFLFEGIAIAVNRRSRTLCIFKSDKDTSLNMTALFPLNSPDVKVRLVISSRRKQRSKAYYLEKLSGKKASTKIIR
jgi:ribosomal protein L19